MQSKRSCLKKDKGLSDAVENVEALTDDHFRQNSFSADP